MARVPIPKKMRDALLLKNAEACCVCKARNVGFNFHHIDGDATNTVEENIAVLCVYDHDAHHRPDEYRPKAAVNHLDLGRDGIAAKKAEWEAFVIEARRPQPAILATFAAYGTEESIHSAKLTFQWADARADGQAVFERVYHLLDAPPPTWADWAVEELVWLGAGIKLALANEPVPVEHCPSCSVGMTRTIPSGFARRLTSTTWAAASICSIYVNPKQSSLALRVVDDQGEAFVASLHRCGSFLDVQATTYHERLPIRPKPSVRTQVRRIIEKLLRDWEPARTLIGTGDADAPELIDDLTLPRCWEGRVR
jgi:hypothetical protein